MTDRRAGLAGKRVYEKPASPIEGDALRRGGDPVDPGSSGPKHVGVGASKATRDLSTNGSSASVIDDNSLWASDTARLAGSKRCRPGVSIVGATFLPLLAEAGASVVGLVGSVGFGVVAKMGYGSASMGPAFFLFLPVAENGGGFAKKSEMMPGLAELSGMIP